MDGRKRRSRRKGGGVGGRGRSLTCRDTLDATTAGEATDGGLGDTLDVVAENLPVALGAALAEALATFSACGCRSVRCSKK